MATVKKGILTRAGEWWVHLRPYGKREFWHRERRAAARDAILRVDETPGINAAEDEAIAMIACYCALSGEVHHVTRGTCCEVCDSFDGRWRGDLPPSV